MMSQLLTPRQAEELYVPVTCMLVPHDVLTDHLNRHKSIIAYLSSINLQTSIPTLREELGIGDSFDDATRKKYEGLLEKKWTSVIRLQKKVRLLSPFSSSSRTAPKARMLRTDHGVGNTELSTTRRTSDCTFETTLRFFSRLDSSSSCTVHPLRTSITRDKSGVSSTVQYRR